MGPINTTCLVAHAAFAKTEGEAIACCLAKERNPMQTSETTALLQGTTNAGAHNGSGAKA